MPDETTEKPAPEAPGAVYDIGAAAGMGVGPEEITVSPIPDPPPPAKTVYQHPAVVRQLAKTFDIPDDEVDGTPPAELERV